MIITRTRTINSAVQTLQTVKLVTMLRCTGVVASTITLDNVHKVKRQPKIAANPRDRHVNPFGVTLTILSPNGGVF